VMTQVDLGLTSVGRFDSADSVISVTDVNQKPGASHLCPSLWKLDELAGAKYFTKLDM
jgi:hypothetical protein